MVVSLIYECDYRLSAAFRHLRRWPTVARRLGIADRGSRFFRFHDLLIADRWKKHRRIVAGRIPGQRMRRTEPFEGFLRLVAIALREKDPLEDPPKPLVRGLTNC